MSKAQKSRIEFDYDGKHYRLEYTAATLKRMEKAGFDFNHLDNYLVNAPYEMFKGAFLANHAQVSAVKIKDIYEALSRTSEGEEEHLDENGNTVDGLTEALWSMMSEALEEISNRGKEGNISWKVTN